MLGTVIGAVGGDAIGDPRRSASMPRSPLFFALMIIQIRSTRHAAAAVLGGLVALALVPLTPAGIPIIAAGLVGLRR